MSSVTTGTPNPFYKKFGNILNPFDVPVGLNIPPDCSLHLRVGGHPIASQEVAPQASPGERPLQTLALIATGLLDADAAADAAAIAPIDAPNDARRTFSCTEPGCGKTLSTKHRSDHAKIHKMDDRYHSWQVIGNACCDRCAKFGRDCVVFKNPSARCHGLRCQCCISYKEACSFTKLGEVAARSNVHPAIG